VSVIALPHAERSGRRAGAHWTVLLARRKTTLAGAILMALMLVLGILAPFIAGDPAHMDVSGRLAAPGRAY
jgi:hypothetical protein